MGVSEIPAAVAIPISAVAAHSKCDLCPSDRNFVVHSGRVAHARPKPQHPYDGLAPVKAEGTAVFFDGDGFVLCQNWDEEWRWITEPLGFYRFAWLPKRSRNGKLRWLQWLEHHRDGTVTLGNRAH